MKRIEAGPFVLYTRDKGVKEWDEAIEDKIKAIDFKPGMGLRKQIESSNKLVIDSEEIRKTIRRLLSKEVKYFKDE